MITYQLEDEIIGKFFIKHLGESGSDRLIPIFDVSYPEAMESLKRDLFPAMRRVRLHHAFGVWQGALTQPELSTIMASKHLKPWKPLLIEGAVIPEPDDFENEEIDIYTHY